MYRIKIFVLMCLWLFLLLYNCSENQKRDSIKHVTNSKSSDEFPLINHLQAVIFLGLQSIESNVPSGLSVEFGHSGSAIVDSNSEIAKELVSHGFSLNIKSTTINAPDFGIINKSTKISLQSNKDHPSSILIELDGNKSLEKVDILAGNVTLDKTIKTLLVGEGTTAKIHNIEFIFSNNHWEKLNNNSSK